MKQVVYTLLSVKQLTYDTYELVLGGDTSPITAPGQFVDLELPGKFLRRPISISDWTEDTLTLLVKAVGEGTREMVAMPIGTKFDVLSGLGNGFDMTCGGDEPLLVGGGIGIAPLYGLARRMIARGKKPHVVLGFRGKDDTFYVDEFKALGCQVSIATEDGSTGVKGFVTDCVGETEYLFTCGPTPMLKALHSLPQVSGGQFSFEARMGCGFGACVGCTVPTKNGPKRVCKDGPILLWEEIVW